jgi:hypothetical protein
MLGSGYKITEGRSWLIRFKAMGSLSGFYRLGGHKVLANPTW